MTDTVDQTPEAPLAPPCDDRSERIAGVLILLLGLGGFVLWGALAPLDSAAVAPGLVAVESARKTVKHPDGGVVSEILVQEGERVAAGQVLIRLDDTQARAQLEIARAQYRAKRAAESRLIAERDGAAQVSFPPDLLEGAADPRVQEAMAGEGRVFEARRSALAGEEEALGQRIGQLGEQIRGLEELCAADDRRIALYREEIEALGTLFAKGLADKGRLRELDRQLAEREGARAENRASIAGARLQIGETRVRIAQLKRDLAREVEGDLREVQTGLADLRERMRALEKTLERTVVKAPVAGDLVQLVTHTVGGVLEPGERILDIVPQDVPLVVEAWVQPNDIDRVSPGLDAEIRLSAFSSRTTPSVPGRVLTVSADRLTDPATHAAYYLARVQVTPEGLATLGGRVLRPGMSAEVLIKTGRRTFFDYLIRPLTDRLASAFRED
jgi:epimerase transport system membrane fusion protein